MTLACNILLKVVEKSLLFGDDTGLMRCLLERAPPNKICFNALYPYMDVARRVLPLPTLHSPLGQRK
jgi:hypothetical protein